MTGNNLNRVIAVLLVAALAALAISPVMATASETSSKSTNDTGALTVAGPQENIAGFDQDLQVKISAPEALTGINELMIDPALIKATPYWVYLAAGKKEQQSLINYIRNADIPSNKKTEWVQFLQATWKKYPLKLVKKGSSETLVPVKPVKEYALTNNEVATFVEIEKMIEGDMEKTGIEDIHVMFYPTQHADFMNVSMKTETYIPDRYKLIASQSAIAPDDWYSDDQTGTLDHSLNHGYMPLTLTQGLGLAPQNTGTYAQSAKSDYLSHDYNDAFTNLGYSGHFMGDLGQPFHTPSPVLLAQPEWIYYAGPSLSTLSIKVQMYQIFHDSYETLVNKYWTTNLPGKTKTLRDYANDVNGATTVIDPVTSAKIHAMSSSAESVPLFYLYEWHYISTRDFDYMSDPVIAAITVDRVQASIKNIRGLVRFVTGGQEPVMTIGVAKPGVFLTSADRIANSQIPFSLTDCTDVPVSWDGTGHVVLYNEPNNWIGNSVMGADDELTVSSRSGSLHFATGQWYQYTGQPDITSIMQPGTNYLTLVTKDNGGGYCGLNVDVWIKAQESAPATASLMKTTVFNNMTQK